MSLTISQALREHGIEVPDQGSTQIRCPFHKAGHEMSPSARAYTDTQSMYCWVCARSWDAVEVWAAARHMAVSEARRVLGLVPRPTYRGISEEDRFVDMARALRATLHTRAFPIVAAIAAQAVTRKLTPEDFAYVERRYFS